MGFQSMDSTLTVGLELFWGVQINPGSPNFRHKARRKALWVDGWATPQWAIQGELQPPVGHRTQGPQDVVRPSRYTYFFNPSFMNDELRLWTLLLAIWPSHMLLLHSSFCEVLFSKKKMEWNSSDKELFDEAGYPRRMVREEVLNLLMPESRGKMYKLSMLLCACKVQVR